MKIFINIYIIYTYIIYNYKCFHQITQKKVKFLQYNVQSVTN